MADITFRAKWDTPQQEQRWEEIKRVLGVNNNAKAFKKLVEVAKL